MRAARGAEATISEAPFFVVEGVAEPDADEPLLEPVVLLPAEEVVVEAEEVVVFIPELVEVVAAATPEVLVAAAPVYPARVEVAATATPDTLNC